MDIMDMIMRGDSYGVPCADIKGGRIINGFRAFTMAKEDLLIHLKGNTFYYPIGPCLTTSYTFTTGDHTVTDFNPAWTVMHGIYFISTAPKDIEPGHLRIRVTGVPIVEPLKCNIIGSVPIVEAELELYDLFQTEDTMEGIILNGVQWGNMLYPIPLMGSFNYGSCSNIGLSIYIDGIIGTTVSITLIDMAWSGYRSIFGGPGPGSYHPDGIVCEDRSVLNDKKCVDWQKSFRRRRRR